LAISDFVDSSLLPTASASAREMFKIMRMVAGIVDAVGERLVAQSGETGSWVDKRDLYARTLSVAADVLKTYSDFQTSMENYPAPPDERRQRQLEEEREHLNARLRALGIEP
jgi:hypothetical protein